MYFYDIYIYIYTFFWSVGKKFNSLNFFNEFYDKLDNDNKKYEYVISNGVKYIHSGDNYDMDIEICATLYIFKTKIMLLPQNTTLEVERWQTINDVIEKQTKDKSLVIYDLYTGSQINNATNVRDIQQTEVIKKVVMKTKPNKIYLLFDVMEKQPKSLLGIWCSFDVENESEKIPLLVKDLISKMYSENKSTMFTINEDKMLQIVDATGYFWQKPNEMQHTNQHKNKISQKIHLKKKNNQTTLNTNIYNKQIYQDLYDNQEHMDIEEILIFLEKECYFFIEKMINGEMITLDQKILADAEQNMNSMNMYLNFLTQYLKTNTISIDEEDMLKNFKWFWSYLSEIFGYTNYHIKTHEMIQHLFNYMYMLFYFLHGHGSSGDSIYFEQYHKCVQRNVIFSNIHSEKDYENSFYRALESYV
ncbi:MAG: hypothetical protein EOP34_02030 [Rickettsiales bacterium]|nr:MAG: hypothetical protein EOP34_02030 [Rickettsiales bacterium]